MTQRSEATPGAPISVGDLVVIVRGNKCCGYASGLGVHFNVTKIYQHSGHCKACGAFNSGLVADSERPTVTYLYKLKRIPPLSELEGVLAQNEIRHPITGKKEIT